MGKIEATTTGRVTETDEDFLREAADRLRLRLSRTAQDIIEVGRELIAVKDRVGHGNFLPWIDREFSMTEKSAERFMSVAKRFGDKSDTVSKLPATVLYELAAPNTTEEVRAEIVGRAESGERISAADVLAMKRAKKRAFVAEHGTPKLIAVVNRGKVRMSQAAAFVRDYPPSQQDGWITKSHGSVTDAVNRANAAKAKPKKTEKEKPQPSLGLPKFISEFTRTDGQVKAACDYNPEDPGDVAESDDDTPEMIRHRIFMHRATEALRHAREFGLEKASSQEFTSDIIEASSQAAEAWIGVTTSLRQRAGTKPDPIDVRCVYGDTMRSVQSAIKAALSAFDGCDDAAGRRERLLSGLFALLENLGRAASKQEAGVNAGAPHGQAANEPAKSR